jgi:adhesin/invasin
MLSASTVTTDANGIASVTAVANAVMGSYTVMASVSGVTPAESFTLTNVSGVGTNLVFTQQPSNTAAGAIMAPVVVLATDNGGNPVSGVTIALSAQGGPGILSGNTPALTNTSGLATFSNLSINKAGTYALQATDGTHFTISASFVISSGTASSITVVAGSGQSAAVGAPYASQLKAIVQDPLGNGVPGMPVTFVAPSSGASVSFSGPATVTTDSTGVAAISVTANTQVGSFQVTATAPGTPGAAAFSLINIAGTASRLAFVQQPTDALAGLVIAPPITVQITDNIGDSVALANIAVTLSINPVTGGTPAISGNTTVLTNPNGLATFTGLSIAKAGRYQFTAIATSLASAQSNVFTISPEVSEVFGEIISAVAGTPQSTTVLAPFAVPLQVLVTDLFDNPLSGVTVTFAAPTSGASATLSATTLTTDANGNASVTAVANAVMGSYTVTASVGDLTLPASFALTNVSGVGANLAFTKQPSNTAAGAIIAPPVVIQVTDNGGNPISGVTIALSAQGGPGVLSGATPVVTDASGLATFSNLSVDKAGTYALQATDGMRFATSNSFVISPATASSITAIAGSGQSAAVGAPYASQLKATVQDLLGNGVPGVLVTFAAPASGAGVSFAGPTTVATDSTGVAAISVTANTQLGSFQVTATAPGTPTPAVFVLTNITGSASRLNFVQQPTDAQAGATITPAVTVQVTDNGGNSVAQAGLTVTLSLNPLTGGLSAISGTPIAITDSNGLATFSGVGLSTAGSYQLVANGQSVSTTQSNTFRILAGAAAAIASAGGTPQSAIVLAPFAIPLQAVVSDSFGNPINGASITFTVPASGASATLSASTVTTDASGRASVTAVANAVAGSYTVTASVSGVTSSATFALTNISGGATQLTFTQQPADTPAGSTIAPVVVQVTDGGHNPISALSVTLALLGGPGSLLGTLSATTDAGGNATFSDLRINTTGTYQLAASSLGLSGISSTFQIGPAVGRAITVIEGNGQNAAVGDNYATFLKTVVRDGLGNPVPGAQVTFTAPTSGASVTLTGSPTVTTDTNGLANSPLLTANSQPGLFQVTASTPQASAQATFDLQNLSATASRLRFVQQPTDTVAGKPVAPAVTIQIVDVFGNPVAQSGVSINLLLSAATVVSRTVTGGTAQTDSSGLATFPSLSVTQAGNYQLLALATGFESALSGSFQVTGGPPSNVAVAAGTPQSTTVRTVFAQPLVALVTDAAGNPLAGTAVTFTAPASGPSGTFPGNTITATAITDANGMATAPAFTANTAIGTFQIAAAAAGVGRAAMIPLANLQPAALTLAFITQPPNSVAGVALGPPVLVQIRDSNGQPVNLSGVAVLMTLSQGTGSLSGTRVQMTDANGIAVFSNLSIDLAGPKRIRAFGTAQTSAESNEFQISAGSAALIVSVSGSGQIVDQSLPFSGPLQARVEDAFGNPVTGSVVTFALPASGASGTFAGSPVVQSGVNGIATAPLITANSTQGVVVATASTPNVALAAQFILAIVKPSGGSLRAAPATMQFVQAFGGSAPTSQTATVVSISGSEMPWTAVSTAPWLTTSAGSGTTPSQITVTANGAGLAPGSYGGLLIVSDTTGNQQTIFVIFTITGAPALLTQPSDLEFLAVIGSNGAPAAVAPQTIQVTSANALVPVNYQATVQVQTPAGGTWLAVSPGSGVTPGSATVAVDPTGLPPGIFSGLVTFTPTDTTISPAYVSITLVVGCGANGCPPPNPAAFAVTNAASFYAGGSPGAAQTLFGNYLAPSTHAASYPLPTSFGGTTVLVNGIAAPLYYVSPTQINFQMPSATPPGSVRVDVVTASGSSSSLTPIITAVHPGLYVSGDFRAKALNQDLTPHTQQTPIPAGGYVLLYMTGMGPATPSVADGQPAPPNPPSSLNGTVGATVGGLPANVAFAGLAPGFAGLIQVNVQIPPGLTPGDQPAFVTVGGVPSNSGIITVK